MLFLSREDVRAVLETDALVDAVARALIDLSAGRPDVPARVAARTPEGLLGAMPGYVPGTALEAKLVTVFPSNARRGLPSHHGLIVLFDERTGQPLAVMDAAHITAARTAAASAVAARVLARPGARVLAILGAGVQGVSHAEILTRVMAFEEVRVASRDPAHARALAARIPGARPVPGFGEAVRAADVVCCCTDASEPVISVDWLAPGTHVSSVGSGAEVDAGTVGEAAVFVEWRGAIEHAPPAGARELQGRDPGSVTEVGEVLVGSRPGRRSDEQLTLYKATGHAVEDAAAARLAFDRARELGLGTTLEL